MMGRTAVLGCAIVLCMTGCVHLESVSTTSVPVERNRVVEVETSRFIFFYMNFDNDYANELTIALAEECPNGHIEGVLTTLETVTYFPIVAHSMQITARGYCVDKAVAESVPLPKDVEVPDDPKEATDAAPAFATDTLNAETLNAATSEEDP